MVHNITPLRNFANSIGLPLYFENLKDRIGFYTSSKNKSEVKIVVKQSCSKHKKIMILAHELGHSLQSPSEFETFRNKNEITDKCEFVMAIEIDAWDKGELLIKKLYKNLPNQFWVEFNEFKELCLGTYKIAFKDYYNGSRLYEKYINFIYNNHADVQPVGIEFFNSLCDESTM